MDSSRYICERLLGRVDLSRLNFVRDKIVLGAARSMTTSYSKQILLNTCFSTKHKTIVAEPFGQPLLGIDTALAA
ncbi:hypothetical protein A1QO_06765, partial [Vibrio genomosp. F10 str. ZF-129]